MRKQGKYRGSIKKLKSLMKQIVLISSGGTEVSGVEPMSFCFFTDFILHYYDVLYYVRDLI